MISQEIFNVYKIEFANKVTSFNNVKKVSKTVSDGNGSISMFLSEWDNVKEVEADLIPVIQNVLDNPGLEETSGSNFIWIELDSKITKLWWAGNTHVIDKPDLIIPTQHFNVIVIAWKDFLSTPPLNGTVIKKSLFSKLRELFFYKSTTIN